MFNNILKYLRTIAETFIEAFISLFDQAAKDAVQTLDNMVRKYTPMALEYIREAAESDLSSDEKRSQVWTMLVQRLQAAGHDVKATGFNAFVNLLIETGVNLLKVTQNASLAQSDPAPDSVVKTEKA